jgi:hypothetical protein
MRRDPPGQPDLMGDAPVGAFGRHVRVELRLPLRGGEPSGQPGLCRGSGRLEFFQGADPVDQHCTIGPGRQLTQRADQPRERGNARIRFGDRFVHTFDCSPDPSELKGSPRRFPLFPRRFRHHQEQVVAAPATTTCC